jgi:hypothetical protein
MCAPWAAQGECNGGSRSYMLAKCARPKPALPAFASPAAQAGRRVGRADGRGGTRVLTAGGRTEVLHATLCGGRCRSLARVKVAALALAFRGLGKCATALQLRPRMRPVHDYNTAAGNHAAAGVRGHRSAVRAMGRTHPLPSHGRGLTPTCPLQMGPPQTIPTGRSRGQSPRCDAPFAGQRRMSPSRDAPACNGCDSTRRARVGFTGSWRVHKRAGVHGLSLLQDVLWRRRRRRPAAGAVGRTCYLMRRSELAGNAATHRSCHRVGRAHVRDLQRHSRAHMSRAHVCMRACTCTRLGAYVCACCAQCVSWKATGECLGASAAYMKKQCAPCQALRPTPTRFLLPVLLPAGRRITPGRHPWVAYVGVNLAGPKSCGICGTASPTAAPVLTCDDLSPLCVGNAAAGQCLSNPGSCPSFNPTHSAARMLPRPLFARTLLLPAVQSIRHPPLGRSGTNASHRLAHASEPAPLKAPGRQAAPRL